jgi:repressor LexA
MAFELTERQRGIFEFIESEMEKRGMPPTVREIAAHFGMTSPNSVWGHLKALEAKGYLKKEPGRSRGMTPAHGPGIGKRYKLAGEVAAGNPILAVQTDDEALTLDEAAGARPGDFLLKVKGESMIGAGINPGDLAVVRPNAQVKNGDIVVALVGEEEATVKRWFTEKDGKIRLVPENPAFAEKIIDPKQEAISVVGKVVGVVRRY